MSEENDNLIEVELEQHSPEPVQDIVPVPVKVIDPVVTEQTIAQHINTYTVVLTSAEPVKELIPLDPLRAMAIIISLDHDIVLCHSMQQAQDPANADTSLVNPNGAVISVAGGYPFYIPLETIQRMYVAGNTFPTRVSVILKRRTPGYA